MVRILTSGGRVLCVTTLGSSVKEAQQRAYELGRHPLRWRPIQARHRSPRRAQLRMAMTNVDTVREYLLDLQGRITTACAQVDGTGFIQDKWNKGKSEPLQGDGITAPPGRRRGRCSSGPAAAFRMSWGRACPNSATQSRPELAGAPYEAMGVSLVFHPHNPYAPTVHMNVRMITAAPLNGGEPVSWFGGGMDLTPYYGFDEDARHFHRVPRSRSRPFSAEHYPRFKTLVRRLLRPEASQRTARHRRHLLRRLHRGRLRRRVRADAAVGDAFLHAYLPIVNAATTRRTASASATSSSIGAGATSSSTWCGTAARTSACNRAGAPSRS